MVRYDLRHLGDNFYDRMLELIDTGVNIGEVGIFLFEVGDFECIQKSADTIRDSGHDLMNSLKFNEVDWTIVMKKVSDEIKEERLIEIAKAKKEAEERAVEEARMEAEKEAKRAEKEASKDAEEAEEVQKDESSEEEKVK